MSDKNLSPIGEAVEDDLRRFSGPEGVVSYTMNLELGRKERAVLLRLIHESSDEDRSFRVSDEVRSSYGDCCTHYLVSARAVDRRDTVYMHWKDLANDGSHGAEFPTGILPQVIEVLTNLYQQLEAEKGEESDADETPGGSDSESV